MTLCPGLPGSASTKKVNPIWVLLKQEAVGGRGISWAICKSAPRPRQIPVPHPTSQFLQAGCPSCYPTNSVKAMKAYMVVQAAAKTNSQISTSVALKPMNGFQSYCNMLWVRLHKQIQMVQVAVRKPITFTYFSFLLDNLRFLRHLPSPHWWIIYHNQHII